MIASGVAEVVSLGSVLPFLAVLSNPALLWDRPFVRSLAIDFGIDNSNELLIPTTIAFVVAALIAGSIRILNLWLNGWIAAAVGTDLSCESYKRTLYQPYEIHVRRNSSSVISNITTQISQTVVAINAFLQLATSTVVSFGLVVGLLFIEPSLAVSALCIFGSAYIILSISVRNKLNSNGFKIKDATELQLKALQEGLGAIRDVLLDNSQQTYIDVYTPSDRLQRELIAKNGFLAAFPRFALEALGMTSIAILSVIYVSNELTDTNYVIPMLGVLALSSQRLLPALQQIYSGWATLNALDASILGVISMLNQPIPSFFSSIKQSFQFHSRLKLSNVSYRYNSESPLVLKDINLDINFGERIGIVGTTGSGKSTLIDLIMGLLAPTSGNLFIDQKDLHNPSHPDYLSSWMSCISHVPQNIYLTDRTILENIAFGVPIEKIDLNRVYDAASLALLTEFIESRPGGFYNIVGERGIQLSGGQRQRIGIARALYKQSQILIFDEATSALDESTEQAVMQAIENLSSNLTIIMIAHRLTTVQRCDRIIKLDCGKIVSDGSPESVLNLP